METTQAKFANRDIKLANIKCTAYKSIGSESLIMCFQDPSLRYPNTSSTYKIKDSNPIDFFCLFKRLVSRSVLLYDNLDK